MTTHILNQITTTTTTKNRSSQLSSSNTLWLLAASGGLLVAFLISLKIGLLLMISLAAGKIYLELQELVKLDFEFELEENLMAEVSAELMQRND